MKTANQKTDSSGLFYSICALLLGIMSVFFYLILQESASREVENKQHKKTKKEQESEVIQIIGSPKQENLARILEGAKSQNPRERLLSLRALQYYGVDQVSHILLFLRDKDEGNRKAAIQILGNMKYLPAVEPIVWNLQREKEIAHKVIGIQALSKICQDQFSLPQAQPAIHYMLEQLDTQALTSFAESGLIGITGHKPKKMSMAEKKLYWTRWLERK